MTKHERLNDILEQGSRRDFLKAAGATGTLAGIGGVTAAQDDQQKGKTINLIGVTGGWIGQSPSEIDDEINPTLELTPGTTYNVVWVNNDGYDHNFVIINGEGDQLVRSAPMTAQGYTQKVTFTATEEMDTYFCEFHPNGMRGNVETNGGGKGPKNERQIPEGTTVGLKKVADGFAAPLGFEYAKEDADRRFIVDQTGQIYVHGSDGLRDEPFLDVSDKLVELGVERLNGYDERGLLGLAFHPDFQNNRKFYIRYSAPNREGTPDEYDHTEVLSEFTATQDLSTGNPDSERVLMEIPEPQMNHNGGEVAFGPDGYLYTSLGDGGAANDVGMGHVPDWYDENDGGNGQDIEQNLLGSILRIDVDGGSSETTQNGGGETTTAQEGNKPYAIPDDNPLVGQKGLDELYAWGFRNPWRMSFNDGQLFVGDLGQNLWEEVDIVEKGGNYGWNVKEGTHCFSAKKPSEPDAITECPSKSPRGEPLLDPIIEYRHPKSTTAFIDGSAVIGGYRYGTMSDRTAGNVAISALQDKYVFGNWSNSGVVNPDGEMFVASEPGDGDGLWSLEELVIAGTDNGNLNRYVYSFGRDRDGELYVLTTESFRPRGNSGAVFKIVPEGQGETLAATTENETTEQGNVNATETPTGNETTTETTTENETTTANQTTANETTQ